MHTFKQHLNEVFDRPVPYKYVGADGQDHSRIYSVELDDEEYIQIEFNSIPNFFGPNTPYLSINFKRPRATGGSRFALSATNKNQFKIYSTVYDIFKKNVASGWIRKDSIVNADGFVERQDKMYDAIRKYLEKKGVIYQADDEFGIRRWKVK